MKEIRKIQSNFQNVLMAIAILSGVLNSFISAYFLNINFTLLVLMLIVMDIFYSVFTRKITINKNYILILSLVIFFYSMMLVSILYSPSVNYKYIKTVNFIVNCIFFSYPLFVIKINFKKIISIIKYVSIGLTIFYVYQKYAYWLPSNANYRVAGNPFLLLGGVYLGLGVLVSLVLIYESFQSKWALVISLFILLLAAGGRGSFVFSLIVIVLFHFNKIKLKIPRKISLTRLVYFFFTIVGGIIVYLKYGTRIINAFLKGFARFQSLASFSTDKSSLGRLDHYKFAITEIFTSIQGFFVGFGIGSYGVMNASVDQRWYPHNIILEAWFEMGVIAAITITLIIFLPFILIKNNVEIKAILFFLVISAMKSSNLTDLWLLFLFIGILLINKKRNLKFK